jgi:hypothetical protein
MELSLVDIGIPKTILQELLWSDALMHDAALISHEAGAMSGLET